MVQRCTSLRLLAVTASVVIYTLLVFQESSPISLDKLDCFVEKTNSVIVYECSVRKQPVSLVASIDSTVTSETGSLGALTGKLNRKLRKV